MSVKRSLSNSHLSQTTPSSKRAPISSPASQSSLLALEQERRRHSTEAAALQLSLRESQQDTRRIQSELSERDARISALERERSALLSRWETHAEEAVEQASAVWEQEKMKAERENDQLRIDLGERQSQLDEVTLEVRACRHEVSMAVGAQQAAQQHSRDLQAHIESLQAQLHSVQSQPRPHADRPPPTSSPSSSSSSASASLRIVQRELSEQTVHLKSLEREHARLSAESARLRASSDHSALLRERLESVSVQASHLPGLQARLARLEMQNKVLEAERESWAVYFEEKGRRPEEVGRELSRLASQNEVLHRRLEMAHESHLSVQGLVGQLEARVEELQGILQGEQLAQGELKKSIRALQRCVSTIRSLFPSAHLMWFDRTEKLLSTERNFLLAQLDNYALERKLEPEQSDDAAIQDMRQAVSDLQAQLQSAHAELSAVPAEPLTPPAPPSTADAVRQSYADVHKHTAELEEELSATHTALEVAQKDGESLQVQLDKYALLVGIGVYDSSSTRVLQLAENPASNELAVRSTDLALLSRENKALLSRLDSHSHSSSAEGAPTESLEVLQAQLEKTQKAVEQKEKAALRMKEIFRVRAKEMREAVAGLLGYRIDMKESGQVRLSSVYTPPGSRHLLFAPTSAGAGVTSPGGSGGGVKEYRLVGDGQGLSQTELTNFQFWIGERKCIPAWLANTFIEEYDGATRGGKFASRTYAD